MGKKMNRLLAILLTLAMLIPTLAVAEALETVNVQADAPVSDVGMTEQDDVEATEEESLPEEQAQFELESEENEALLPALEREEAEPSDDVNPDSESASADEAAADDEADGSQIDEAGDLTGEEDFEDEESEDEDPDELPLLEADDADDYEPRDIELKVKKDASKTVYQGDTLKVIFPAAIIDDSDSNPYVAGCQWDNEWDENCAYIYAFEPGKAKFTFKLANKKKIVIKLTVKDPYQPASVSLVDIPKTILVGETVCLGDGIVLKPSYARSEKYTWKSSKKKVVKVDQDGFITGMKTGSAKITVTTANKKKTTVKIKVKANKITGLSPKPGKKDIAALGNAFTIWPKSIEYKSPTKAVCEFYILNGSKTKIKYLRDFSFDVGMYGYDDILGSTGASKIKVSCGKRSSKTFKVTISGDNLYWIYFLSEWPKDSFVYNFNSEPYGQNGKKQIPFVPTVIPNMPDFVPVTGISLNKSSVTLKPDLDQAIQLIATVKPSNASHQRVDWDSSNYEVAFVDNEGFVSTYEEGTAIITAMSQDGEHKATCKVTVANKVVKVTGVSLDKISASIEVGETLQLTATVAPSNATNKSVTWTSSNTSVATVSGGKVTAKAVGSATITVKTVDGSKTASCAVTVTPAPVHVTDVTLDKPSATVVVGKTLQLMATVAPLTATNRSVSWSSSATSVATVDSNGKVTAKAAGSATITVKTADGNKTATCKVTVIDAVWATTPVALTPCEIATGKYNKLLALDDRNEGLFVLVAPYSGYYTISALNDNDTSDRADFWIYTYENENYEVVNTLKCAPKSTTPVSVQTIRLYAGQKLYIWILKNWTYGSFYDYPVKTVIKFTQSADSTVPVTGVTLDKDSASIEVGKTLQLTATVAPSNATNKSVTWTSSATSVASVDSNGKVTAKAAGTATITAKTADGGKTATCKVTVVPDETFSINPSGSTTVDAGRGYVTVTITATTSWSAKSSASWLTLSKSSGSGNSSMTLTATANTGSSSRTATVTFTYGSSKTATLNVTQDGSITPSFTVTHKDLSGTTLTMSPDACAENNDTSTLAVKCNKAWTATLTNTTNGFLKIVEASSSSATVNSTGTSASGSANTQYNLCVQVAKTPAAGSTSTAKIDFKVDGTTYKTITIQLTKPVPSGSVVLTVRSGSSSGSKISDKQTIEWPINQVFKAICSQTGGNGKYLVKSYVMSGAPSFKESDVNKLVTGVGYNGTGYFYGSNGNDEFSQSTMDALPIDPASCIAGQYIKVWIAAEDVNYTSNKYTNGVQFALKLTKSNVQEGTWEYPREVLFTRQYSLTGDGADDIVSVAMAQYNAGLGSSLNSAYPGDWCAAFVSDCAILANQSGAIPYTLLAPTMMDNLTQVNGTPQKGDVVVFRCPQCGYRFHVGLMVNSTMMLDGNGSGANGRTICYRSAEGITTYFWGTDSSGKRKPCSNCKTDTSAQAVYLRPIYK